MERKSQQSSQPSKPHLRRQLRAARMAHPDRAAASQSILRRLSELEQFQQAATIGWYVDAGSEVITRDLLRESLDRAKRESSVPDSKTESRCHAVPFCDGDDLVFYSLRDWNDLEIGAFNILAPKESVRNDPQKIIDPSAFDLLLIPAVGFDRWGNRLGQGKGFYDRYLKRVEPESTLKIGLALDCQLVNSLPSEGHDEPVDAIITENSLIWAGSTPH